MVVPANTTGLPNTCCQLNVKLLAPPLLLLDEATAGLGEGGELPGETAFKLYDTFGFPYDLTEDALRARNIGVDKPGFDAAMALQKAAARARPTGC